MPRLRIADPLWLAGRARREGPHYPKLASNLRADVAIVGGGVTGATVAWMFARSGVRVVVLDAARVGRGSTAASTALLMQEPDTDFAELARRYGPKERESHLAVEQRRHARIRSHARVARHSLPARASGLGVLRSW